MSNEVKRLSSLWHFNLARPVASNPTIVWKEIEAEEYIAKGAPVVLTANPMGTVEMADAASPLLFGIAAAAGYGAAGGVHIPIYAGDFNNVFVGRIGGEDMDMTDNVFPFNCDIIFEDDDFRLDPDNDDTEVVRVLNPVEHDTWDDEDFGTRCYFKIYRSSFDGIVAAK